MSSVYGESTVGVEAGTLTAKKCKGILVYDLSVCGSPIHPNRLYCYKCRKIKSDQLLDSYNSGDLNREDAEKLWMEVSINWEEEN